jgi:hypothetical protein
VWVLKTSILLCRLQLPAAADSLPRSRIAALTALLAAVRSTGPPSRTWRTFLANHVTQFASRPMPVEDPRSLVTMYQTGPRGLEDSRAFSYPELLDYGRQVTELTGLAGSTGVPLRVTGGDRPELIWGQVVTDNYFAALEPRMAAGRGFRPDDHGPVAVVSYQFWQRRFNGDPHVIGRSLPINGQWLTVVGVTGRGFTCTQLFDYVPDVSIPLHLQRLVLPGEGNWMEDRTNRWITTRARLGPGSPCSRPRRP